MGITKGEAAEACRGILPQDELGLFLVYISELNDDDLDLLKVEDGYKTIVDFLRYKMQGENACTCTSMISLHDVSYWSRSMNVYAGLSSLTWT